MTELDEAIALLQESDNYLDDGFEEAIDTVLEAAAAYSRHEQTLDTRIKEFIQEISKGNLGYGEDPLGFILSGYRLLVHERKELREELSVVKLQLNAKHACVTSKREVELEAELDEQCRLLGKSGTRELELLTKIERLECDNKFFCNSQKMLGGEIAILRGQLQGKQLVIEQLEREAQEYRDECAKEIEK